MTNLCVWPGGLIDNYFKTVGKWEIILMIYMFIIYVLKNWNPGWSKKKKKTNPFAFLSPFCSRFLYHTIKTTKVQVHNSDLTFQFLNTFKLNTLNRVEINVVEEFFSFWFSQFCVITKMLNNKKKIWLNLVISQIWKWKNKLKNPSIFLGTYYNLL